MRSIFAGLVILLGFGLAMTSCSKKEEAKIDPQSDEYLFAEAAKAELANHYDQAITIYQNILEQFPKSSRLDKALFMIGFIKTEYLEQRDEALSYFHQVIDKYPKSDLVDDAQFMIETIESGQDAVTRFEEKTATQ